jgi:hypothetical protein
MNFFLSIDGSSVTGPHSLAEITASYQSGGIPLTSQVCPSGADQWQPLTSVLSAVAPPALPPIAKRIAPSGPKSWSLEDRSEILDAYIQKYLKAGYRVTSRTETTAQFIKPKEFSAALAIICLLLAILPFFLYLLIYLGEKDKVAYVSVGSDGKVTQTAGNDRGI